MSLIRVIYLPDLPVLRRALGCGTFGAEAGIGHGWPPYLLTIPGFSTFISSLSLFLFNVLSWCSIHLCLFHDGKERRNK